MKILLTNDDGIKSIGIRVLAEALTEAGHEVLLVAPDRECSGCGHAMTIGSAVTIQKEDIGVRSERLRAYSCSGMPTDCVIMAMEVLDGAPDLLISGINQGPNLGDDLTYSGTICAAMEGVIFDLPSIAVSLNIESGAGERHNETAAKITLSLIEWLTVNPMGKGVLYNVNVPNVRHEELKGVEITRKGIRRYVDKITRIEDAEGKEAYLIGGKIEDDKDEGTDIKAVADGKVSITPVHMEMTAFDEIDRLVPIFSVKYESDIRAVKISELEG